MRPLLLSLLLALTACATAFAEETPQQTPAPDSGAPTVADSSAALDAPAAIAPKLPNVNDPNNLTPAESKAWRDLRETVTRERTIWDRLLQNPDDDHEQQRANAEFRAVITAYENLIRSAPQFAEAYAAYGLLLNRTGNREQAARIMLQANQINPALPMVKNELGNYLFEDGRYKDALGYYLAAIELKGDEPLYHYQLGSLLREYRRFFLADGIFDPSTIDTKLQDAFRRAAELAPDTWGYTYRYAESFYDVASPDWHAALAEWTKLEGKAKPGVEKQAIHLHQAHVLAQMGLRDEARLIVDSVVEPSLLATKEEVLALIDAPEATEAAPTSEDVQDGDRASDAAEVTPTTDEPAEPATPSAADEALATPRVPDSGSTPELGPEVK
jgi:tetratricopeptide (TPR) repeat protein